jgi:hypothetical protein
MIVAFKDLKEGVSNPETTGQNGLRDETKGFLDAS